MFYMTDSFSSEIVRRFTWLQSKSLPSLEFDRIGEVRIAFLGKA